MSGRLKGLKRVGPKLKKHGEEDEKEEHGQETTGKKSFSYSKSVFEISNFLKKPHPFRNWEKYKKKTLLFKRMWGKAEEPIPTRCV